MGAMGGTAALAGRPVAAGLKIKLWRVKGLTGQLFYKVGAQAEYSLMRAARTGGRMLALAGRLARWGLLRPAAAVGTALAEVWQDLFAPFAQMGRGAAAAVAGARARRAQGEKRLLRAAAGEMAAALSGQKGLLKNLFYYLLPLAAGGVFVFTVVHTLDFTYALRVECGGQPVGVIGQEAVYQEAARIVQDQIIYTGEGQHWSLQPVFTIQPVAAQQLSEPQALADAILRASGKEIVQATGLYVDGTFCGAVTEGVRLRAQIDALKAPYEEQNPGAQVEFVQQVELRSGIYLTESVCSYSALDRLLQTPVEEQSSYLVQQGDTPLQIAGANGITLEELYALNPGLEEGGNLLVGETLTVGGQEPFLQVKLVTTVTEQQEIPYTTVTTEDNQLAYPQKRVTQEGVNGLQEVTYQVTYVDGRQVEKTQVGEPVVLAEPVEEHISEGTYIPATGAGAGYSGGAMTFPVGAGFTYMSRGFSGVNAHNGLDLCAAYGTPIYAAESGVVTYASATAGGYGIHVRMDHGNGVQTLYGHCSALAVYPGQVVSRGQLIAYVGSTGNSTGNHCHFEVIINGVRVNPGPYVGM